MPFVSKVTGLKSYYALTYKMFRGSVHILQLYCDHFMTGTPKYPDITYDHNSSLTV